MATPDPPLWYKFAPGQSDGNMSMKSILGGKGANLAEMCRLGIPVPPGFTLPTSLCNLYAAADPGVHDKVASAVRDGVAFLESNAKGARFGLKEEPLLVSIRSGARASMPGMMDTVLNCGLNWETVKGLKEKTGDERFAMDCFRRFIQMYSDVVMSLPKAELDHPLEKAKKRAGVQFDHELSAEELRVVVEELLRIYKGHVGAEFPVDPYEQLTSAVLAVFDSWGNKRAITYRRLNNIPDEWGTACNVQMMVFGNFGETSGTGVAFSRDPALGNPKPFGEWLPNAQGEDVVAGIRNPGPLWAADENGFVPALETVYPALHAELVEIMRKLERHYLDIQDVEFTIQDGTLYMLQCRIGKRTPIAALKIAVDMVKEGLIDKKTAIKRVTTEQLDQLLHPQVDPKARKRILGKGLAASPGAAAGQIVLNADDAEAAHGKGLSVILVRTETSAEDVGGMHSAKGILTKTGGMTSHAAVVARGMGRPCISGCSKMDINEAQKTVTFRIGDEDVTFKAGDCITIDGAKGEVYEGLVPTVKPTTSGQFGEFLGWCDDVKKMKVYANADTPEDAANAVRLGAQGIGLVRTEHMFFRPERILHVRAMILADDPVVKKHQLDALEEMQRQDFEGIFEAMHGKPVSIRLLDPPLHEFLPKSYHDEKVVADELGISREAIHRKADQLHEYNPMLGHRGCRLGITYPEIYDMQVRACITAAVRVSQRHVSIQPQIMVPLVMHVNEIKTLYNRIHRVAAEVIEYEGFHVTYEVGTMIELPRAALVADQIADYATFFSFGTNDLTQSTMGLSRDDAGKFLTQYQTDGILDKDPFKTIDEEGVGALLRMACDKGRDVRPDLKCGVCGEHGGDPESIGFCAKIGMDYVSCSPFRIPAARLASAQAAIEMEEEARGTAA